MNIFIDVDGTLLNSNEGVDPRAQEILRQIRLKIDAEYPDSGLYLWSGAGGDYARCKATEHGVVSFFSGFTGKPDVIIDDNPSSVFPRRTIVWDGDNKWQNLKSSLFAEHSPTPQLLGLVRKITNGVLTSDVRFKDLYRVNWPRHSIPFFGDLENAEVITLAVNPSSKEFDGERGWSFPISVERMTIRLVNYFRQWNPPPHAWFTRLETELRLVGCSYHFNTAHIDLSPRATRSMRTFRANPGQFLNMVKGDATKWLLDILFLAKRAREIRFEKSGIISKRGNIPLAEYIESELPTVWREMLRFKHSTI